MKKKTGAVEVELEKANAESEMWKRRYEERSATAEDLTKKVEYLESIIDNPTSFHSIWQGFNVRVKDGEIGRLSKALEDTKSRAEVAEKERDDALKQKDRALEQVEEGRELVESAKEMESRFESYAKAGKRFRRVLGSSSVANGVKNLHSSHLGDH